jgi:hypothetical protein
MVEFETSNKGYVRHGFLPELKNARNLFDIESLGFKYTELEK